MGTIIECRFIYFEVQIFRHFWDKIDVFSFETDWSFLTLICRNRGLNSNVKMCFIENSINSFKTGQKIHQNLHEKVDIFVFIIVKHKKEKWKSIIISSFYSSLHSVLFDDFFSFQKPIILKIGIDFGRIMYFYLDIPFKLNSFGRKKMLNKIFLPYLISFLESFTFENSINCLKLLKWAEI